MNHDLVPSSAAAPAAAAGARRQAGSLGARTLLCFAALLGLQGVLAAAALASSQGTSRHGALACVAVALAATLAMALWLLRALVQPVAPLARAVDALRAADLSVAVEPAGASDLRAGMGSLLRLRERLFQVVSEVRTGMINVATHAMQIKGDTTALAQRTGLQAESVQQTAVAIRQLETAIRENAQAAQRAHALARSAAERARVGGAAMGELVDAMHAIRGRSHDMREIIGVIDGIAFQTGILALNAAVEAARAGDQGRGFAVVAGEVRSLAQRCADAARDVKTLIAGSVDHVGAGAARVEQAGHAVADIVQAVDEVAGLAARMDASARAQQADVACAAEAIATIEGTTRDNAAFVQAAERTVSALHARAAALCEAVAPFHLGPNEHAGAQDTVALVRRGCEFLRRHGRQAFLDEVHKLDAGRFIYRDLYLCVLDLASVRFVAHGNNPSRLGTGPDVKDVDGKPFPRDLVQRARSRGEGWVDYKWVHPVTGQVFQKSGFVQREGDLAVYAALYVS